MADSDLLFKKLAKPVELMHYPQTKSISPRTNEPFLHFFLYLFLFQPKGGGTEVSARSARPKF
jgi:hypothetical protein